jgi:UDP-N-acetylmuramate dehydrogenase
VLANEPMAAHTSFGVGGPAEFYVEPRSAAAMVAAVRMLRAGDVPMVVLGAGTNVLVSDLGVKGAVVCSYPGLSRLRVSGSRIVAAAGVLLGRLCHAAADAGLSGLEAMAGIPGTLGGALFMNAGANGTTIGDLVETAAVLGPDGQVHHVRSDELDFGYRWSNLREKGWWVLEATLSLSASNMAKVHESAYGALQQRCAKQPVASPSAGSIFKRPPGDYAGRMVEEAGAKGLRVGGAEISGKHANFIVNVGGATAADVVALIREAQRRAFEQFGVWLEPEVCMIGEGFEDARPGGPCAA